MLRRHNGSDEGRSEQTARAIENVKVVSMCRHMQITGNGHLFTVAFEWWTDKMWRLGIRWQ